MKTLVIVRHGSFSSDGNLDHEGSRDVAALGKALMPILENLSVQIISSTAPRAEQTAAIAAAILGVDFEKDQLLWSGPGSPHRYGDVEKVMGLIQGCTKDVLVLVTHYEYGMILPVTFGKRFLNTDDFPMTKLPKGMAWVIDYQNKTCTLLPSVPQTEPEMPSW